MAPPQCSCHLQSLVRAVPGKCDLGEDAEMEPECSAGTSSQFYLVVRGLQETVSWPPYPETPSVMGGPALIPKEEAITGKWEVDTGESCKDHQGPRTWRMNPWPWRCCPELPSARQIITTNQLDPGNQGLCAPSPHCPTSWSLALSLAYESPGNLVKQILHQQV